MKVAFVDIDGTLIKGQTQIHFLSYLFWKKEVSTSDILKVIFWYLGYKLFGRKINESLAANIYEKLVGGKSREKVSNLINDYFERMKYYIYPGARSFIEEIRSEGFSIVLLTSTPCPIAEKFKEYFSADETICTKLEINDEIFTGKILGRVNQGATKSERVSDYIKKINPRKTLAASDHITDLPVFEIVDRKIVINPDRRLLNFAKQKKWEIIKL